MRQDVKLPLPRVVDHGRGHVIVALDGRQVRGWSYQNDEERRLKTRLAQTFVDGWVEALTHTPWIGAALEQ
jgi:hypothetical protein